MLDLLSYLRRRWAWGIVLLFFLVGVLSLYTDGAVVKRLATNPRAAAGILETAAHKLNSGSAGGVIGTLLNDKLFGYFGRSGATILYALLDVVSLLFLTNFRLGEWMRGVWAKRLAASAAAGSEEEELERRALDLEKQARKLQEQVDKSRPAKAEKVDKAARNGREEKGAEKSGLGADMQPVPEPTVRDLSVPSKVPKAGRKQPEPVKAIEPPDEGVVIPAQEVAAATAADILGKAKDSNPAAETKDQEPVKVPEPVVTIDGDPKSATANTAAPAEPVNVPAPLPKPRVPPKKKPIAVASTPHIGNYQLPSIDLLHMPDLTVKPTESKEELMANARLMQQTLAQFDIDVQLGDITKGPTITRYELHPAPGVKLEKIAGLSNNIAAALKAERINILEGLLSG
jgi:S-DNA-T family DNA segregation ATPase FtsK/SpoIIIE